MFEVISKFFSTTDTYAKHCSKINYNTTAVRLNSDVYTTNARFSHNVAFSNYLVVTS